MDGETDLTTVTAAFRKFCENAKMGGGTTFWAVPFGVLKEKTKQELNKIMTTGSVSQ